MTMDGKPVTTWQIVSTAPCFFTKKQYEEMPFECRLSLILLAAVWCRKNGHIIKISEQ